nr:AAA family ATPase [Hydrogenoanaerobacterium saccharovorans]
MLYGEPGVGKSLMAEALIEESGCRSFFCWKDASGTLFIWEQLAAAEVERYYRKAKEIFAQNQDFLEKMAPALVDRGFCCPGSEE